MKKILAIAAALLLALGCFGASAESVTFSMSMNENILALLLEGAVPPEQSGDLLDTVTAFMDAMTVQAIISEDGTTAQTNLRLKGETVATVSASTADGQIVIVSDLFPEYAILTTEAELREMIKSETSDPAAVAVIGGEDGPTNIFTTTASGPVVRVNGQVVSQEQLDKFVNNVMAKLQERTGAPVPGEYVFEDVTFHYMSSIDLTLDDVLGEVLQLMQEAAPDTDGTKELAERMNQASPEELATPVNVNLYFDLDEDGEIGDKIYAAGSLLYKGTILAAEPVQEETEADVEDEGMSVFCSLLALAEEGRVHINAAVGNAEQTSAEAVMEEALAGLNPTPVVFDMTVTPGTEEDTYIMSAGIYNSGVYIGLGLDFGQTSTPWINLALHFPKPGTEFLTAKMAVDENGTITMPASAEGKTTIPLNMLPDSLSNSASAEGTTAVDPMSIFDMDGFKDRVRTVMPAEYDSLVELYNAFLALNIEAPDA